MKIMVANRAMLNVEMPNFLEAIQPLIPILEKNRNIPNKKMMDGYSFRPA